MGYKITKDNIHSSDQNHSLVGQEYEAYEGGKHKFRLLDDDGGIYLYGISDSDLDFGPLDYFMPKYGCTEIQYFVDKLKEYKTL